MNAGFAKTNVNPPIGMPIEGLGQVRGCDSIHDDLFVRALYLEDAACLLLIFSVDLLFFERAVIARFKGTIGRALGIAPGQILLNTTHTHAGPRVSSWAYSDGPNPEYLTQVERALVDAATRAKAALRPVTLTAGQTTTRVPVSRRQPDADGKAQWAPYRAGVICDALPFCLLRDAAGQVMALLFSVSCHPSMIYESSISADYPGAATRRLNAHFKSEGAMFLQGAGGDTKPEPVAVEEEHWKHGTWDDMERAGAAIADAVIAAAQKPLARIDPELKVRVKELAWPLQPAPNHAFFENILRDPEAPPARRRWAEEMRTRAVRDKRLPTHVPVTLHVARLGRGLRLIGIEGEVVGELGNRVLAQFADGVTFVLGYTNGCQIYLPTTRMLPEGGYEVDSYWEYHWPAPLAPNGEDVLLDAVTAARRDGMT